MADVSSGNDAEISSDCSRIGIKGVCGTEKESSGKNSSSSFPDHSDNGSREHVFNEVGEEGLLTKVLVVLLKDGLSGLEELKGSKVVAFLLKSSNDGSN